MKVKDLKPAGYNPRKISKKQLEMLAKSMKKFGDLSGIIYNKRTGRLIGGHQRIKHLNPEWEIVIQQQGTPYLDSIGTTAIGFIQTPFGNWFFREVDWDEDTEMAANIAANQHGGDWEFIQLSEIVTELYKNNIDLDLLGFEEDELKRIFSYLEKQGFSDENEVPNNVTSITEYGDMYKLGVHILLCGDATKKEDLEKLLANEKVDLVFTDPPYGFENTEWLGYLLNKFKEIEIFIMNSDRYLVKLASTYFEFFRNFFVVELTPPILVNNDMPMTGHDLIAYFRKGVSKFANLEDAFSTHLKLHKRKDGLIRHEKKIDLPIEFIKHYTMPSDVILDLFGGSGTTMIACEKLNRRCLMMEIDPCCCDIIVERWCKYTNSNKIIKNGKEIKYEQSNL